MKLVKEHINEIFTQDSDPVHDLGIGIRGIWENLKPKDILKTIKFINHGNTFPDVGEYILIHQITHAEKFSDPTRNNDDVIHIRFSIHKSKRNIARELKKPDFLDTGMWWEMSYGFFKEYFRKVYLEDINESINEKFKQDSDPVHDLGVGYTPEKLKNDFIKKLLVEFPDLQYKHDYDFEWNQVYYFLRFSLWPYTEDGMNNLDKAIRKVINKYFKKYLVIARDYNREKIGIPEHLYSEEDIFVKMKIKK